MNFTCKRCLIHFERKDYLKKHLLRKKTCDYVHENIDIKLLIDELCTKKLNEKTYDCEYCKKQFNLSSTKCEHKKICKLNPLNNEIVSIPKAEYLALQNRTAKMIVNNNTTNNTQNIIVNNFGQEDISHLLKRLEYYWHNKAHGLIEMTKDIHFDPKHPENHTLNLTNQRNKIIKVKDKGKWVPKETDEAIDEVVYTISKAIEGFMEDKSDYLKDNFPKIVLKTNEWWDKVGTGEFNEKEYNNMIRNLIDMVILNRHVIVK
jgi:hypothetical protein